MKETRKAYTRRFNSLLFHKVFKGDGIDIGCGAYPVNRDKWDEIESVDLFDIVNGDAQYITDYCDKQYDFVHSSHCLEHMEDPFCAIYEWWQLVAPGGYLVLLLPDEDLYEQGVFPSTFNNDHKWTFTIYKKKSWSPVSINLLQLSLLLEDCQIIKMELIDTNYNYNLRRRRDQSRRNHIESSIEIVLYKFNKE